MEGNSFEGEVPDALFSLSDIISIRLTGNNGLVASLPEDLSQMSRLQDFLLGGVTTGGTINDSLFQLTTLRELDLSFTQVNGTLSEDISILQNLSILRLNNNTLTGTIPSGLASLTGLSKSPLSDIYVNMKYHEVGF